ncbi:uncharacterized protein YbjT (DUF2867 family) [Haloferula luteola]|uniref:Uncharacterized protein YbjT (DUF2867 family) n=1 Tax=Haloferula luteola TaxID=595692 RepID=A0A840VAF7_9BACT|nr:NAD(P)H-binding protein [Haloferula luteola]MBB5350930.1 uncharacterized protein YbjT (DUF2867 family) [Haloferula luteola]
MKVTIFGGTGRTGKPLIERALQQGMDVTVFARPSTPFANPRVRVVRGDLLDRDSLTEAIRGADAVLSALGPTKFRHPKDQPITRATDAMISVMKQEGIRRFICISTGTARDPHDGFDWKIHLPARLIKVMMPAVYRDIVGLAAAVRASQLEWTMVRVAFLNDRPATTALNVGVYGRTRHTIAISREDVAQFMLDQISSREFIRKTPGISAK